MTEYEQIKLEEWTQVGEGGNGKTYENPARPGVLLKINNERLSSLETVSHEFETSTAVARLGIPTPKMIAIVRAGEAYGTLSERIEGKKSLSRLCHDQPWRLDEIAVQFTDNAKELFSTLCDTTVFPSRKQQLLKGLELSTYLDRKSRKLIRAFADQIPEGTGCLHGDFQPGNLILAGDNFYWIDLDRFAYGDPMFDIGHLFLICNVYCTMSQVQDLFHMSEEYLRRFWDAFAKSYTGSEDHTGFDRLAGKFAALDIVVRPVFVAPSFLEKLFFRFTLKKLVKQYY